jgi:uncharacterized protein YkwD
LQAGGYIVFLTACLFFGLLAAAEPAAGLPPATPDADTLTVPIGTLSTTENSQQTLLNLINSERTKAGLKLLEWDDRLAEAARDHAEVMSRQGRLSHQFDGEPDLLHRLNLRSIRLDAASENVVYDVSAEGAHEAFAKSPRHRDNMLNDAYDGVGIAVINLHGILYVVEDFAHRITDLSDEAAADRIAGRFAALRQQSGLPPLEIVGNPHVQALVEQMAARQLPDSHAPLSLPGARFAASYATTNVDEVPASVARVASLRGAATCTVGVHFARTSRYPSGLFWVSIVMFEQNTALARN